MTCILQNASFAIHVFNLIEFDDFFDFHDFHRIHFFFFFFIISNIFYQKNTTERPRT